MKHRVIRFAALAAAGLVLASCGSDEAELQNYAKARGMSDIQTAAFMSCATNLRKKMPAFPAEGGNLVMTSVPLEICACKTQTIMAVFGENKYKAYATFATYMATDIKKRPPRFGKKDLKKGTKSPVAAKKLEDSLNTCVQSYKNKHKDKPETEALFKFVPVSPPEGEEKKTADAAH